MLTFARTTSLRIRPYAGRPEPDSEPKQYRLKKIRKALSDIIESEMSFARRKHRLAARHHSEIHSAIKKAVREIQDEMADTGDESKADGPSNDISDTK